MAGPVRIVPQDWSFEAGPGDTLFQAARHAGIRLPTSCRNGTCRACMSRLEAGAVVYPANRPGLTREERDEGWVLPCIAVPDGPVTLCVPEAAPWDAPR